MAKNIISSLVNAQKLIDTCLEPNANSLEQKILMMVTNHITDAIIELSLSEEHIELRINH